MNLDGFVLGHEIPIRLAAFFGIFAVMAVCELWAPCRALTVSKRVRWVNNIGLVVLNSFLLRLIFPAAAVGVAVLGEARGWGVLHDVPLPGWAAVAVAILAMDFAIYLQHVMFHAVPAFWRLHRMHHADLDIDVTTGARFHPIEVILSMCIKFAVIIVLGASPLAVILFEIALNATSMFNHANVRLPRSVDRLLRLVVVTPDMHRVHHSVRNDETNSNFGFNLPWWDRLLGTYRDQPEAGHQGMTVGLQQFRDPSELRLDRLLVQPFIGDAGNYPINRRSGS